VTLRRLALVGVAALTACGGDRTVLRLATWADYREADVESRALAPFEDAHPSVIVRQQPTEPVAYRERLLTALASGDGPDLFLLDGMDVSGFAAQGAVLDLAPYLSRLGVDLGRYDSTALGMFRRGGAVYALPQGYTPIVVAYNKDLFDRAGVPYPADDWTWDEFLRLARILTRDTDGDGQIDQWGTVFDRRAISWLPWLWSGGGDVVCANGLLASGCLDGPTSVAAIRWITGWVITDSVVPPASATRDAPDENVRLFCSGRVAMLTTGHFSVPVLRSYGARGRLRVGFVEIPHLTGSAPRTAIYASGLAVPARAGHRKLSVELAAYLADSLAQAIHAGAGLDLPSLTAAGQTLAIIDTTGWESVFLRVSRHARPPWGARNGRWEIEAALPDMMDRIVRDHVDPAQAAREMARRIDALLAGDPR